jgi:ribosome-dependent ATPase
VKTQIAAITATGIITAMPAVEYSGYILPVSSLSTDARIIGSAFPSSHFFQISMGAFTKGLGFQSLLPEILALAGIVVLLTLAASAALREQEA